MLYQEPQTLGDILPEKIMRLIQKEIKPTTIIIKKCKLKLNFFIIFRVVALWLVIACVFCFSSFLYLIIQRFALDFVLIRGLLYYV